jgi:tetratricopeptide (TPR) repeat protein
VYHYARSGYLAAKSQRLAHVGSTGQEEYLNIAELERWRLQKLEAHMEREPGTIPGGWPGVYGGDYKNLTRIYLHLATARLAVANGSLPIAEEVLRHAVEVQDSLSYMEPPRLLQPARQCLGYVLLTAGKPEEAQAVYEEDLRQFPENGYSLLGLSKALAAQQKQKEAQQILDGRFKQAWQHADGSLSSSCPSFSSLEFVS